MLLQCDPNLFIILFFRQYSLTHFLPNSMNYTIFQNCIWVLSTRNIFFPNPENSIIPILLRIFLTSYTLWGFTFVILFTDLYQAFPINIIPGTIKIHKTHCAIFYKTKILLVFLEKLHLAFYT